MELIKRIFCKHKLWTMGILNEKAILLYCDNCGLHKEMVIKNSEVLKRRVAKRVRR